MKVMIIKPNEDPYIERIWNDLETFRKKLGDVEIEVVEYNDLLVVYNSRGLIDNVPINRFLDGLAIRGTFLITSNNTQEMEFEGLSDEQIEKYMDMFSLDREEEFEL